MKKLLLFSSLLTVAPYIFSQSVTAPTIPEAGVYYEVGIIGDNISFSNEGDWDFSTISTTSKATIHIAPIYTSSEATNYPNATHVKYEDGNQFFLGFTDSEYTFHGEISVLTSSYPNPLVIHPYPFNVGNNHIDTELEVPFTVPNGPPYLIRDDRAITEAISTGTITMPDNTIHNNAVLVRSRRTWTDRQIGSSPCVTSYDAYQWWVEGYAIPVVQSSVMTQSGACPPSNPVIVTKFVVGGPLNVNGFKNSDISIYPNPVKDKIHIIANQNQLGSDYAIFDQLGRNIAIGKIDSNNTAIDLNAISKGIYFIRFSDISNQSWKFIKE
ncbi:MAG: T9SS type A sorting domain-containing protein [Bacteroidia bacterium]|nr:T9SS type A sorting domain-containing protein [Bacteroidia bacterium]MDG2042716.1 T9SS type A sorting domain-containing protein [Bacteroidia bacterium]